MSTPPDVGDGEDAAPDDVSTAVSIQRPASHRAVSDVDIKPRKTPNDTSQSPSNISNVAVSAHEMHPGSRVIHDLTTPDSSPVSLRRGQSDSHAASHGRHASESALARSASASHTQSRNPHSSPLEGPLPLELREFLDRNAPRPPASQHHQRLSQRRALAQTDIQRRSHAAPLPPLPRSSMSALGRPSHPGRASHASTSSADRLAFAHARSPALATPGLSQPQHSPSQSATQHTSSQSAHHATFSTHAAPTAASHSAGFPLHSPSTTLSPVTQTGTAEVPPRRTSEIVLPRWQPDVEVNECPICGRTFGLWYRKHHCRKCGRVVCASCSPHRITIPRQFIVHPPTAKPRGSSNAASPTIDLTGEDDDGDTASPTASRSQDHLSAALGGGQEVRLCNPCVPDPNPSPPPGYPSTSPTIRRPSDFAQFATSFQSPSQQSPVPFSGRPHFPPTDSSNQPQLPSAAPSGVPQFPAPASSHSFAEGRWSRTDLTPHAMFPGQNPHTIGGPQYHPHLPFLGSGLAGPRQSSLQGIRPIGFTGHPPPYQADQLPFNGGSTPFGSAPGATSTHDHAAFRRHRPHHRAYASTSHAQDPRYRSMLDVGMPSPASSGPPPPPPLAEEDECPVCHLELPPKDPDGGETAREAHVAACIAGHFRPASAANTSTPNTPSLGQDEGRGEAASSSSSVPIANAMHLAGSAGGRGRSESARRGAEQGIASARASSSSVGALGISMPTTASASLPRRRTTGMVVYHATEKDCLGADEAGTVVAQECVICFEDFEPGVEMGRLECLCKFHRVCIRQWWDTKGVGACPVHQGGLT